MRAWIYGGGPIGAELARKLALAYKSDTFFQVYGMTEAGPVGTTLYPEEQVGWAVMIGHPPGRGSGYARGALGDGIDAGRAARPARSGCVPSR